MHDANTEPELAAAESGGRDARPIKEDRMARKKPESKPPAKKPKNELSPEGYEAFLAELKERIKTAQIRASLAVNHEMISLYWRIGTDILARQEEHGWGAKVIDRLSQDLRRDIPNVEGFSPRNLKYMRAFAQAWPEEPIVQQLVAQIPWGHNVRLLDMIKSRAEREWYIHKTVENGWSRGMLVNWIESGLYKRQGKAQTNFQRTLPKPQSDLARETLKDPYKFEFLTLADEAEEKAVEEGLLAHIRKFLIELGAGFAFVGQQVRLEVGGEDFYVDLLFYHLKLRCYVVIDLKATAFKPEYAGKMNFYLSAIDDLLRHPDDKPSIGIVLCKAKNEIVAEYALRDLAKPVGVSCYVTKLVESLPPEFRGSLPSPEQWQAELEDKDSSKEKS
jgi:predicted nuclease of restriction endonuclease-like (RecB) superfamily